jgi:hypothetical protein
VSAIRIINVTVAYCSVSALFLQLLYCSATPLSTANCVCRYGFHKLWNGYQVICKTLVAMRPGSDLPPQFAKLGSILEVSDQAREALGGDPSELQVGVYI